MTERSRGQDILIRLRVCLEEHHTHYMDSGTNDHPRFDDVEWLLNQHDEMVEALESLIGPYAKARDVLAKSRGERS